MSRMLTVRLSQAQHHALRSFAFVANVSMNEVVLRALEDYLKEQGSDSTVDALLQEQRARLRQAVRGLDDD